MNFRQIIKKRGIEFVAKVTSRTVRQIRDLRRGHTAATVDDLYSLAIEDVGFDPTAVVEELGSKREKNKKARRYWR